MLHSTSVGEMCYNYSLYSTTAALKRLEVHTAQRAYPKHGLDLIPESAMHC